MERNKEILKERETERVGEREGRGRAIERKRKRVRGWEIETQTDRE